MKIVIITLLFLLSSLTQALEANTPAPDFTLPDTKGSNQRLKEFRGNVVLLNFWASWCGPCRQEMPILDELHKKYEKLGFVVIGVNLDGNKSQADKYLKDVDIHFPILYGGDSDIGEQYSIDAMPTTYIIDNLGNLRHLHRGYKPGFEDKYEKEIKAILLE